MTSKYPASERVTAGKLAAGDQLLIRERLTDQPFGTRDTGGPLATGVWTVVGVSSQLDKAGYRRARRTYTLVLEHPGAGQRTVCPSPSERFNRVLA
jgi:hypothetical protein